MKGSLSHRRPFPTAMKAVAIGLCSVQLLDGLAFGLVGGARLASGDLARPVVGIVGERGSFCTATAIARDVLLTAGHCMQPGATYKVQYEDKDGSRRFSDIVDWKRPSQFIVMTAGPVADLALLKIAKPLPADIGVAALDLRHPPIWPGDRFTVVGEGITLPGLRETGVNRVATLVATAPFTNQQFRLIDASGSRNTKGACAGDSGAPVFQEHSNGTEVVVGVVSWATGPNNTKGCGGITGATLLSAYRRWIEKTANDLKHVQG